MSEAIELPKTLHAGDAGDDDDDEIVFAEDGRRIADAFSEQSQTVGAAIAAEIVRRWNAHEALLAALKEMKDNCGCCEDTGPCANCERADAAIAAATGT